MLHQPRKLGSFLSLLWRKTTEETTGWVQPAAVSSKISFSSDNFSFLLFAAIFELNLSKTHSGLIKQRKFVLTFCFVLTISVKAAEDFGFFNLLRDRVEKFQPESQEKYKIFFIWGFFNIFSSSVFTYSGTDSLKCLGFQWMIWNMNSLTPKNIVYNSGVLSHFQEPQK